MPSTDINGEPIIILTRAEARALVNATGRTLVSTPELTAAQNKIDKFLEETKDVPKI